MTEYEKMSKNEKKIMYIIAERFPIFWYHAYMANEAGKLKEFIDGIITECWDCFNDKQQKKLMQILQKKEGKLV